MKSNSLIRPILASLIAFAVAATLGLAMRFAFVLDMPEWFNYRNVQHAHSHVALLGWLFGVFSLCIIHYFNLDYNKYSKLYWSLQATVLGMLLTFPVVGYAALSIAFSTAHIILSYILAYKLWVDVGSSQSEDLSKRFVRTSLFFMVISTLGTWALGPLMAMGLKGSAFYYAAIQFYLHFQFNGWFIFATIGIGLAMMYKHDIHFPKKKLYLFYKLLTISTILTYALAISWSTPLLSIFVINSIGVILQLVALLVFLSFVIDSRQKIQSKLSNYTYRVLLIALLALTIKIVIQAVVVIPYLAEVSYTIRNFVIGFIHLLMLGCLSLFAFGSISSIIQKELSSLGTGVFLLGVVSSEILLFTQGLMLWQGFGFMPYYYWLVSIGSACILLGLIMIIVHLFRMAIANSVFR